ncbi:sensor histidine kinase [uncultured Paraglaciecola sp.]|uniref:sensor histidine kinase n=1 Tax=uncultured Paraglaciecola sp. TaxID=1765024 RepID=UPI0026281BA4|nr:histidine kinase [uncultured Paraglaciecola sp.]
MKLAISKYVPLITALVIVAHILFFKSGNLTTGSYLSSLLSSCLISIPFFLSAYFSDVTKGFNRYFVLMAGFIFYPLLMLALQDSLVGIVNYVWSVDEFAIFFACYFFANIRDWLLRLRLIQASKKMTNSVTLFNVMLFMLISGSFLIAFILSADPQFTEVTRFGFTLNIDAGVISASHFFSLLLQCLFLSSLLIGIYYINSRYLIKYMLSRHGVYIFLCSVIICTIMLTPIVFSLISFLPIANVEHNALLSETLSIYHKNNYQMVLVTFLVFTPLILLFEKQKQTQEINELSQQKKLSEMMMLQQQVNPHFLFNTLNNIYAQSLSNSNKTPKLISRLANMLRHTVYEGQKSHVSLSDEIQFLKNFIELQKLRARDNLTLKVSWPENQDSSLVIAPLLLIIIIENAFKHSIEKTSGNCAIAINLSIDKNQLNLTCENTFVDCIDVKNKASGLGLSNLQKRLNIIYPDNHQLKYGKFDECWKVTLTLELTR